MATTPATALASGSPDSPASRGPFDDAVSVPRYVLATLASSAVNLVLNALAFALILKDFYRAHPAGSEEFVKQLNRPADQLVPWAMVVTSLTMGLFITIVIKWSGARTFVDGLKRGALVGLLFWTSVNSGLYASSHVFSLPSVLVDTPCSAFAMTMAAAVAAAVLRRPRSP